MPAPGSPRSRRDLPPTSDRFLRATESSLRKGTNRQQCLVRAVGPYSLDVTVGKRSITRAVRLMSRLLRLLAEDGCTVTISEDHKRPTIVRVDGQDLQIRLREGYHQTQHVMTVEEEERLEEGKYLSLPALDYHPSGVLHLEIREWWVRGVPVQWADRHGKQLERQLESFVRGLHQAAANKKARLEEKARQEHEAYQRALQAEEVRRKEAEEQKRFEELLRRATRWEQAALLRRFLDVLEAKLIREFGQFEPGGHLDSWFHWARARADRFDPVEATVTELRSEEPIPPSSPPPRSPP